MRTLLFIAAPQQRGDPVSQGTRFRKPYQGPNQKRPVDLCLYGPSERGVFVARYHRVMTDTQRFDVVLEALLSQQRVASLATVDEDGMPHASMVPFAVDHAHGTLLIHISGMSPHFGYLHNKPHASLLIAKAETPGAEVHALPRMSIQATASFISRHEARYAGAREAYLQRFPEVAFMTDLPDFAFVEITPLAGRVIAGFGAAKKLDSTSILAALQKV